MRNLFVILSIVLFCVLSVNGRSRNRNALSEDTSLIADFAGDSTKYTKWFELSDKENIGVIIKFDDTTSSGFSGDSIGIAIYYQLGNPVYDSSNEASNEVKAPWVPIFLDSVTSDSLGKAEDQTGMCDSLGTESVPVGLIDTTNIPGWAYWQMPEFYPRWSVFIRFKLVALAGHCDTATPIEIAVSRRRFIKVHEE